MVAQYAISMCGVKTKLYKAFVIESSVRSEINYNQYLSTFTHA